MTPEELDNALNEAARRAQKAAEERLELAYAILNGEADDLTDDLDAELAGELAGPFCGCVTCEVREVLDAAFPHLRAGWEAEQQAQGGRPDWIESVEERGQRRP